MCTVSVISLESSGGYRLVTNRDEQRSRPEGDPPAWRRFGSVSALAPLDPLSGGTWVATNSVGLSLCLLNGNLEPAPPPPTRPRSRGLIIPALIGATTLDDATDALATIHLDRFAPFRLVIIQMGDHRAAPRVADAFWNGRGLELTRARALPACFVSSGLGDSRVTPRFQVFDSIVRPLPIPESQDAFHRHAWPDRPEISVCMSRADARTVSITAVTVEPVAGASPRIESVHHLTPTASSPAEAPPALAAAQRFG